MQHVHHLSSESSDVAACAVSGIRRAPSAAVTTSSICSSCCSFRRCASEAAPAVRTCCASPGTGGLTCSLGSAVTSAVASGEGSASVVDSLPTVCSSAPVEIAAAVAASAATAARVLAWRAWLPFEAVVAVGAVAVAAAAATGGSSTAFCAASRSLRRAFLAAFFPRAAAVASTLAFSSCATSQRIAGWYKEQVSGMLVCCTLPACVAQARCLEEGMHCGGVHAETIIRSLAGWSVSTQSRWERQLPR